MNEELLPTSFEELRDEAKTAIAGLEKILKVPVPVSIKDAVDGRYLESAEGVAESIVGRVPSGEMEEWRKRVIPLARANAILRSFEGNLVRSYVLKPSSPLRIIVDGVLLIPKWILAHLAEITMILIPLLTESWLKALDVVSIERRITELENFISQRKKMVSDLFAITPRPAGTPAKSWDDAPTAAELQAEIKNEEYEIGKLERERDALAKLSADAGTYIDRAVIAVSIMLVYFSVQKLLGTAKVVSDSLVSVTPAKDLRNEAIEKIKAAALPQARVHRVVVKKRSRRN